MSGDDIVLGDEIPYNDLVIDVVNVQPSTSTPEYLNKYILSRDSRSHECEH